jgi:hypothetical protein
MASIFSFGIDGLRPRPRSTTPRFARRSRSKRARHAVTVAGDTPTSAAIAVFARPSAAASNALARLTSPCVAVCARLNASSTSRSPSVITKAGEAGLTTQHQHNRQLYTSHYTSRRARRRRPRSHAPPPSAAAD